MLFFREGFRERQNEGFGSSIYGEMRKWLEANDGREIYDSSTPPLDHWSKDMLGQLHKRFNIQPYLTYLVV
jgi:hypothetical protein